MRLYVIQAECGDYYCGCGGGHILGIATTEAHRDHIIAEAKEAKTVYIRADGKVDEYKKYPYLDASWNTTIAEYIEADECIPQTETVDQRNQSQRW